MMSRWSTLIFSIFFTVTFGYSQPLPGDRIPFDIVFWRKELRLKKTQVTEVHFINQSLYNSLLQLSATVCIDGQELETLLQLWQVSLSSVLTSRQKRKWKKLMIKYANITSGIFLSAQRRCYAT
jgi:hypothetical protein